MYPTSTTARLQSRRQCTCFVSTRSLRLWNVDTLWSSDATCRHGSWTTSAKPLPELILTYCQMDSYEQTEVKFESKFTHRRSRSRTWKRRLQKVDHFVFRRQCITYRNGEIHCNNWWAIFNCAISSFLLNSTNVWEVIWNKKWPCNIMTSPNGNIFRVTGHLCEEFTGPWWIPRTKASDAELWCFLWSALQ